MKRAAVVVHPHKHGDVAAFRAEVSAAMTERGWAEPLWLETTVEVTGEELTRQALQASVDLVLASGGDGTITACVRGIVGSGIPLAVLPCGTGNLLATNLDLPLNLDEALAVALTGACRPLDVGVANGLPFVVMAGIGFDAGMLAGTSEDLKRRVGWAAYVLSALRRLGDRPASVVLRADGRRPQWRLASGVVVGNVGSLPGHVQLMPDAEPDDGILDVAVLAAWGWAGWLQLAFDLLLRRKTARLARMSCRELSVRVSKDWRWQVDGEVPGLARQLTVTVRPGDLLLRVPRAVS